MSLAANIIRLPLHPVDQYKAFAQLASEGKSPGEIAATFACSERLVRQRIALGNVHPPVLDAYAADQIQSGYMKEFASADLETQVDVWEKLQGGKIQRWEVPELLRGDRIRGGGKYIGLVSEDEYLEAGGVIEPELFADEDADPLWLDVNLLKELHARKVNALMQAWRDKGFVNIHFVKAMAELRERLGDGAFSTIWDQDWAHKDHGDEAEPEPDWIDEQKQELYVIIEWDGGATVLSWESRKQQKKNLLPEQGGEADAAPDMSNALRMDLIATAQQALQVHMMQNKSALAYELLIVQLAARKMGSYDVVLKVQGSYTPVPTNHVALAWEKANNELLKLCGKIHEKKTMKDQLVAFRKMSDKQRALLIGGLVADHLGFPTTKALTELSGVFEPDMTVTFKPTAEYFDRLKKPELLAIGKEEGIELLATDKKSLIVSTLAKRIRKDWLPTFLRGYHNNPLASEVAKAA